MFGINDAITDLKIKERTIFKILYSMNSHPVSMPGYAGEEARCYILLFSEGPNLSSFIGFYLSRVDRKFFYSYSSNPFPFEAAKDVEEEARAFADDMGFLLDEINVSGMAADDRNQWIEEQFIFGYRKPEIVEGGNESPMREPDAPEKTGVTGQPPPAMQAAKPQPEIPVQEMFIEVIPAAPQAPEPPPALQPFQPAPHQLPQQQPGQPPQGYPAYPPDLPPQQPAPGYPPEQQAYPPAYPPYPPAQQPTPERPPETMTPMDRLEPPEPDHPENLPPKPSQKPAPPLRGPVKKKAVPQTAPARPAPVARAAEALPDELEYDAPEARPRSLFEEAIKEGVVKPPRPKPAKPAVHGPNGVVSRDKEALARLLASF